MKKIVSILMAAAMVFALAGCTPPEPPTEPTNPTPAPTDPPTEPPTDPTDPTDPPIVIPAVEGSANVFYQIFVGSSLRHHNLQSLQSDRRVECRKFQMDDTLQRKTHNAFASLCVSF